MNMDHDAEIPNSTDKREVRLQPILPISENGPKDTQTDLHTEESVQQDEKQINIIRKMLNKLIGKNQETTPSPTPVLNSEQEIENQDSSQKSFEPEWVKRAKAGELPPNDYTSEVMRSQPPNQSVSSQPIEEAAGQNDLITSSEEVKAKIREQLATSAPSGLASRIQPQEEESRGPRWLEIQKEKGQGKITG